MVACEQCWSDAYMRSRMLGGSQVEHYNALLIERAEDSMHTEFDVPAVDPDTTVTPPGAVDA